MKTCVKGKNLGIVNEGSFLQIRIMEARNNKNLKRLTILTQIRQNLKYKVVIDCYAIFEIKLDVCMYIFFS